MNIIVAGIYRSGSTWLFNAVRLLMLSEGHTVNSKFFAYPLEDNFDKDCNIIKVHYYYPELFQKADIVITSYRNYKDIIKSMKAQNEKGLDPQFANAGNWQDLDEFIGWLLRWNMKSRYMMEFDDLINNKRKVVEDLHIALKLTKASVEDVLEQLQNMKPPKVGLDKETLLTSTHYKG